MSDILIPQYPDVSYEGWLMFEMTLPEGFRHVASVARPDANGDTMRGDVYDLGQNAEGVFRLFKRGTGVLENSHCRGETLSDEDLVGFGLTREDSPYEPGDPEYGDFSSLNRTMLIKEH